MTGKDFYFTCEHCKTKTNKNVADFICKKIVDFKYNVCRRHVPFCLCCIVSMSKSMETYRAYIYKPKIIQFANNPLKRSHWACSYIVVLKNGWVGP